MSDALQEQFVESESFKLRRLLPWLNLFRAFRLAVGLRVLILGIIAALLLAAGEYAISWMPFAPQMQSTSSGRGAAGEQGEAVERSRATWPWERSFLIEFPTEVPPSSRFNIEEMARQPWAVVTESAGYGSIVLWPARTVIDPAATLFSDGLTWSKAAVAWCRLVWALLVWSALGVAIVRIVVLEFSNRESPSLSGSVKFSLAQLPSALGSVILPSVALAGLYLVCRIAGLVAYASWLRPIVGVLWIIDLLCGLGMAVILLLLAASWPLIVCAIAVDRGDSFEGFTRAFSYVFGRPWYALWLLLLTTLYGSIVFVFIVMVASGAAHLAETSAGGHAGIDAITAATPPILRDGATPAEDLKLSGKLAGFWLNLWATAIAGFVASFFWSATSIAYLLLRKSVDATPIEEIHDGDAASQSATLPLSGVAAAEQREQQFSAGADETPNAPDANQSEA